MGALAAVATSDKTSSPIYRSARLADGHQPAKEEITVLVGGNIPVKGETGTDRFVLFGYAAYSPVKDQVQLHPWDPLESKYM